MGEAETLRAGQKESPPGREEVPHDGGDHQALDRLFVEARRELAADVEEVVKLEHLDREGAVDAVQLVVHQPVLDWRRRAGRQALQEAPLLAAERGALGARTQTDESDDPPGLAHRAHEGEPELHESGLRCPGRERPVGDLVESNVLWGPGRETTRRAKSKPPVGLPHVESSPRHLQLAHHDE